LTSIAFALVLEHVFGVRPCILCTYQRLPYVATAGFGLFGLLMPLPPHRRRVVVQICSAIFAIGAAIAAYHMGVEQGWWTGSKGCTGENLNSAITMADLQMSLTTQADARCDDVPYLAFGLSLPTLNLIASSVWCLFCLGISFEKSIWREQYFRRRA